MNKLKMTEILGGIFDAGRGDGSLTCGNFGYVNFKPSENGAINVITLDGSFSVEELEALLFWMKSKAPVSDKSTDDELMVNALLEGRTAYFADYEEHGTCPIAYPANHIKLALERFGISWDTGLKINQ